MTALILASILLAIALYGPVVLAVYILLKLDKDK